MIFSREFDTIYINFVIILLFKFFFYNISYIYIYDLLDYYVYIDIWIIVVKKCENQ